MLSLLLGLCTRGDGASPHNLYFSVYRFNFIMIACNLLIIFRDKLISLVIFAVEDMSPLVSIAALSCLSFRRNQPWRSRSLTFVPCAKRGAAQA